MSLRLLICIGIFALTALGWAEPVYGLVRGIATFENGIPYAALPVTLQAGAIARRLITQENGSFCGLAPAGVVVVSAPGCSASVTVPPGEQASVKLSVKHGGILLVTDAPKVGEDDRIDVALVEWTAHNGAGGNELRCPTAAGNSWYPEVPPNAAAFTVKLWWEKLNAQCVTVFTWKFPAPAAAHTLHVPLGDRMTTPEIMLVDEQRRPLANAAVEGTLCWTQADTCPAAVECQLVGFCTTPEGKLLLPQYWLPRPYRLTLTVNGKTGVLLQVIYGKDGRLTPAVYVVKKAL